MAFFVPEFMIWTASNEWCDARQITKLAHDDGHDWWTMTHSHFILNGGFALHDGASVKEVDMDKFLPLLNKGVIVNPVIMEDDIKDKSVSDGLAKAILVVQLSWFMIQIIVRLVNHLAVTLIELDTVCLALLTVPLIFLWWNKPRCAGRPHVFYTRDFVSKHWHLNQEMSQTVNALETSLVKNLSTITVGKDDQNFMAPSHYMSGHSRATVALLFTWTVFGALHAIAWNYEFPTEAEKIMWRASSLTLAGSPTMILFGVMILGNAPDHHKALLAFIFIIGVISRVLLVALMLASLRSLPPSVHEVIPWTSYIPHL